jgi:3-deoxy-manno-octulosonate cytidylyltransferase (CMP-KDO synthetase)
MTLPRNPVVVIPARLASTRLPRKVLAEIRGEPLLLHVWRRAVAAGLGPVWVACAEAEVAEVVQRAGGRAVLTRPEHPSGSDRVFEALSRFDPDGLHDSVINLQGDLPTIDPRVIAAVLRPLADPSVDIATLVATITEARERDDPNVVKAVLSPRGDDPDLFRALYFSRAQVPSGEGPCYHHIGLYAYRRQALARFVALPPGVLERRERLEQLRGLENGMRIDAARVDTVPLGVDTPADLERARALIGPAG